MACIRPPGADSDAPRRAARRARFAGPTAAHDFTGRTIAQGLIASIGPACLQPSSGAPPRPLSRLPIHHRVTAHASPLQPQRRPTIHDAMMAGRASRRQPPPAFASPARSALSASASASRVAGRLAAARGMAAPHNAVSDLRAEAAEIFMFHRQACDPRQRRGAPPRASLQSNLEERRKVLCT